MLTHFIDIPMFNVKYVEVHEVHMYADAIRTVLYGVCLYIRLYTRYSSWIIFQYRCTKHV